MKKIIILLVLFISVMSCQKARQPVFVQFVVSTDNYLKYDGGTPPPPPPHGNNNNNCLGCYNHMIVYTNSSSYLTDVYLSNDVYYSDTINTFNIGNIKIDSLLMYINDSVVNKKIINKTVRIDNGMNVIYIK